MSKLAVFLAEGFEEIEALTVVDVCRRAELEVSVVSVRGGGEPRERKLVEGAHGIVVRADTVFEEVDFTRLDMIVLPGGGLGTKNLEAHGGLMERLEEFYRAGKYVAAICAAPSILGHRGMLKGRKACSYPALESHLEGAQVSREAVAVSGTVVTSRGMGTAIPFSLAITEIFCGREKARSLAEGIVYHDGEEARTR
ncbi:MAG: DJ-1/PfpI family protein [Clostridium sp.]|jgi:4-methyl-5(b-hydroxyethyl)-thiazole monophosphate biosynthesis|nr:DJ-1/PfpI family protein [Clostridium sp.]